MIPEFLGRFSVVASLEALKAEDLRKILVESNDSVLNSYKEWFASEGVELIIEESALDEIVKGALERGLGARGLQNVLDDVFLMAQFDIPSMGIKPKQFVLNNWSVKTGVPELRF